MHPSPQIDETGRGRIGKTALVVAALLIVTILSAWGGSYVPQIDPFIESLGPWGPLLFVAIVTVAAVALVPGSILKMSAGALFGIAEGTVWAFVGSSLGALAAFYVARHGGRRWIESRLHDKPRLTHFDRAVGADGRRIVFLLRLSPAVPYNVINYVLGLSSVRSRDYALAMPGMIPSIFLYVYTGKIARDVLVAASEEVTRPAWEWGILGVGFVATIAAGFILSVKAKRAVDAEVRWAEEHERELTHRA